MLLNQENIRRFSSKQQKKRTEKKFLVPSARKFDLKLRTDLETSLMSRKLFFF